MSAAQFLFFCTVFRRLQETFSILYFSTINLKMDKFKVLHITVCACGCGCLEARDSTLPRPMLKTHAIQRQSSHAAPELRTFRFITERNYWWSFFYIPQKRQHNGRKHTLDILWEEAVGSLCAQLRRLSEVKGLQWLTSPNGKEGVTFPPGLDTALPQNDTGLNNMFIRRKKKCIICNKIYIFI